MREIESLQTHPHTFIDGIFFSKLCFSKSPVFEYCKFVNFFFFKYNFFKYKIHTVLRLKDKNGDINKDRQSFKTMHIKIS